MMPVDGLTDLRQALASFQRQLPRTVQLRCQLHADGLHVERLHVVPSARGGQGSEVLRQLLALMDHGELPVTLHAQASGRPTDPSQADLLRWYGRFGFEIIAEEAEGPFMQRSVGALELNATPSVPPEALRRKPRM